MLTDLDLQIQFLIDHAPQDGTTPRLIQIIAPALQALAQQLAHRQYYILQTAEQNWLLTTLSNRTQPDLEKKVVYAFPNAQDAVMFNSGRNTLNKGRGQRPVQPQPMAVTHILFQMLAIDPLDSIVFFENIGNFDSGTEVQRTDVQKLVQSCLEQYQGQTTYLA